MAQKRCEEALEIAMEAGDWNLVLPIRVMQARVALSQGDYSMAHARIREIFSSTIDINGLENVNSILVLMAILAAARNQLGALGQTVRRGRAHLPLGDPYHFSCGADRAR